MEKIIIIGGGGHSRVLLDILALEKARVLGFSDLKEKKDIGIKYLGDDRAILKKYPAKDVVLVNGVGSVRLPQERQKIYERFKVLGYRFRPVVHPQSVRSSNIVLGEGVQIMAGVVINPGVKIAEDVIVNTSASIDHDCRIGAHTHIAPGVVVSGEVIIGKGCHVGIGAKIRQGTKIGDHVFIKMGAVVVEKEVRAGSILT